MKRYICSLLLACFTLGIGCAGSKSIVNLRTHYEKNPLGIEESPRFSWEMRSSDYGAVQTAYRLLIADSENHLKKGKYLYDSGKQSTSLSVCIDCAGFHMQPCTRYYWKVMVWDEKGKRIVSSQKAWFESGLLDKGWDNAQWIGSHASTLSKYNGKVNISYDFTIAEGSSQSRFVFGYRDKDNYMDVIIDVSHPSQPLLKVGCCYKGNYKTELIQDISEIIAASKIHRPHHINIQSIAFQHHNGYDLDISLDGKALSSLPSFKKKLHITIETANTGYKYARLYSVGFWQDKGQNVTVENFCITEPFYKDVLYKDSNIHYLQGNGKVMLSTLNDSVAAPMLRKTFKVSRPLLSARLYATAKGIYELYINGSDVSNGDYYQPGWPDYRFCQTYNTYDVTSLIHQGNNAIGAMLGNGYYTGPWGYHCKWSNGYGTTINLLAKLVLAYQDGTTETIVTDPSWIYTDKGPVLENSMQNGVDYDARREIDGWNQPDFDDSQWKQVKIYSPLADTIRMQAYIGQPVRVDEICTALKMTQPLTGHYIYDMGQNMVGIPRLRIKGQAGQAIRIRYAEMLYPDIIPVQPIPPYTVEMYRQRKGQMYIDNYRGAISEDTYICKGDKQGETFEPRFTSHGFRYIEITGIDKPLPLEDVKVLVLNSIHEETAQFETDDDNINRLYSNIVWGQKGNFLAVPTDCPQRDERLGWTGDAQIFTRTSTYNRNVQPFFNRWLYTVRDDQSSKGSFPRFSPLATSMVNDYYNNAACGWAEVGIITPWEIYQQYGDIAILEKSYASMKRYMDYLESQAQDYIQPIGGYGDWVALLGTPSDLTNTAYSALDARIMEKVALVLGRQDDAVRYRQMFEAIKKAFAERYLRQDGYLIMPAGSPANRDSYSAAYGNGPKTLQDTLLDTQTGYILPLYAGLLDDSIKSKAVSHLVELLERNDYKLNTGFIGTPYMNIVLSENGCDDIAYRMFQQKEYPSWLYPVFQGATTIWERWNSYTIINGFGPVDMNSFNHYSYGAIQDWMMAYCAGIQRDESSPGYHHILLQPRIGGTLGHVCARFSSVYGDITSMWTSQKPSKEASASRYGYTYHAIVPANTTATLTLPLRQEGNIIIKEGNKGIKSVKTLSDRVVYELSSGRYAFQIQ